ncbi:acid proteinase [Fusarium langsethiae]|uniref:Acid proteinase n=1 Tax=Fusarium langsethiae TaxID=179993 RepID=A0A0M9ETM0_FUSLA|nr:acid proteinase [Fusarium langsethiae]GKU04784.1 unnamed protein product [Fusarium langsethiae]
MGLLHLVWLLIASTLYPMISAVVRSEAGLESWDLPTPLNGFSFERARALSASKSAEQTGVYVSRLKKLKTKNDAYPRSSLSLLTRPDQPHEEGTPHQNVTAVGAFSTAYAIQCTWDQIPVWLIFDTGSSDTWAAKTCFGCENSAGDKRNQAACNFGQPHIQGFLKDISEVYFHRRYGSGEDVAGPMGTSDIACGGVPVSGQQVGLASRAYWHGDNVTVGVLGLAYPSLTSAYIGDPSDQVDDSEWNSYPYTPWLTSAFSQGLIDPVFSVTIDRNTSDGVLSWGALPPMHWHPRSFASTDLIIAKLVEREVTAWRPSFYTIIPDGLQWGSTTDTGRYPYIIDTGTTMMLLPPPLAEAIARSFDPPATYMVQWGAYFVDCKAIPPRFAVIISGVYFWINPADMIYQELTDPSNEKCALAISTGGSGPYVLGDVFLQNVVAVFDVGGAEMRFYSRD